MVIHMSLAALADDMAELVAVFAAVFTFALIAGTFAVFEACVCFNRKQRCVNEQRAR
jgi:hypothetical protein